tara:strand:+ start:184 stop:741 length:558 start_codon:yes stop_codon:yes gene_type:complete
MKASNIGLMSSPNISYETRGWIWAADNGCFSDKWDSTQWLAWLNRKAGALFATVPDVVGDAAATRLRWDEWHATVAASGHLPAYVLQDGQDDVDVPWDDAACVFIGGSTEYKLSESARRHAAEARRRGLWVHMGRVNSYKRLSMAADWGCNSADGTLLAFGPDILVPKLLSWITRIHTEPRQLVL